MAKITPLRLYMQAPDRRHLPSLITVRAALEGEYHAVHVRFVNGQSSFTYTREDLPAIRQKIMFSM